MFFFPPPNCMYGKLSNVYTTQQVYENRRLAQREATVLLPHLPYILQVIAKVSIHPLIVGRHETMFFPPPPNCMYGKLSNVYTTQQVYENRRLAQREATVLLPHLPYILQILPTKLLLDNFLIAERIVKRASSLERYFANAILLSRVLSGLPQSFQKFVDVVQKSHPYFANLVIRGKLTYLLSF